MPRDYAHGGIVPFFEQRQPAFVLARRVAWCCRGSDQEAAVTRKMMVGHADQQLDPGNGTLPGRRVCAPVAGTVQEASHRHITAQRHGSQQRCASAGAARRCSLTTTTSTSLWWNRSNEHIPDRRCNQMSSSLMNIDDVDACQLLSTLPAIAARGTSVVTCATVPMPAHPPLTDLRSGCDTRVASRADHLRRGLDF